MVNSLDFTNVNLDRLDAELKKCASNPEFLQLMLSAFENNFEFVNDNPVLLSRYGYLVSLNRRSNRKAIRNSKLDGKRHAALVVKIYQASQGGEDRDLSHFTNDSK
jgi:hypothetical protein